MRVLLVFLRASCVACLACLLLAVPVLAATVRVVEFAPRVISITSGVVAGADAPAFSPDGNTVVFDRSFTQHDSTLYISKRVAGKWTKPQAAPFSGRWIDQDPTMAPDGSYLIFASTRPTRSGGKPFVGWQCNLWRVDRHTNGTWGRPAWLPLVINHAGSSLVAPSLAADSTLYFLRHDKGAKHGRAYVSRYIAGRYTTAEPVIITGEPALVPDDIAIAPDQSFMVFDVLGTQGSRFYLTFRRRGQWTKPLDLGPAVNAGLNWDPRIAPDGRRLYFSSTRSGHTAIWSVSLAPWLVKAG